MSAESAPSRLEFPRRPIPAKARRLLWIASPHMSA